MENLLRRTNTPPLHPHNSESTTLKQKDIPHPLPHHNPPSSVRIAPGLYVAPELVDDFLSVPENSIRLGATHTDSALYLPQIKLLIQSIHKAQVVEKAAFIQLLRIILERQTPSWDNAAKQFIPAASPEEIKACIETIWKSRQDLSKWRERTLAVLTQESSNEQEYEPQENREFRENLATIAQKEFKIPSLQQVLTRLYQAEQIIEKFEKSKKQEKERQARATQRYEANLIKFKKAVQINKLNEAKRFEETNKIKESEEKAQKAKYEEIRKYIKEQANRKREEIKQKEEKEKQDTLKIAKDLKEQEVGLAKKIKEERKREEQEKQRQLKAEKEAKKLEARKIEEENRQKKAAEKARKQAEAAALEEQRQHAKAQKQANLKQNNPIIKALYSLLNTTEAPTQDKELAKCINRLEQWLTGDLSIKTQRNGKTNPKEQIITYIEEQFINTSNSNLKNLLNALLTSLLQKPETSPDFTFDILRLLIQNKHCSINTLIEQNFEQAAHKIKEYNTHLTNFLRTLDLFESETRKYIIDRTLAVNDYTIQSLCDVFSTENISEKTKFFIKNHIHQVIDTAYTIDPSYSQKSSSLMKGVTKFIKTCLHQIKAIPPSNKNILYFVTKLAIIANKETSLALLQLDGKSFQKIEPHFNEILKDELFTEKIKPQNAKSLLTWINIISRLDIPTPLMSLLLKEHSLKTLLYIIRNQESSTLDIRYAIQTFEYIRTNSINQEETAEDKDIFLAIENSQKASPIQKSWAQLLIHTYNKNKNFLLHIDIEQAFTEIIKCLQDPKTPEYDCSMAANYFYAIASFHEKLVKEQHSQSEIKISEAIISSKKTDLRQKSWAFRILAEHSKGNLSRIQGHANALLLEPFHTPDEPKTFSKTDLKHIARSIVPSGYWPNAWPIIAQVWPSTLKTAFIEQLSEAFLEALHAGTQSFETNMRFVECFHSFIENVKTPDPVAIRAAREFCIIYNNVGIQMSSNQESEAKLNAMISIFNKEHPSIKLPEAKKSKTGIEEHAKQQAILELKQASQEDNAFEIIKKYFTKSIVFDMDVAKTLLRTIENSTEKTISTLQQFSSFILKNFDLETGITAIKILYLSINELYENDESKATHAFIGLSTTKNPTESLSVLNMAGIQPVFFFDFWLDTFQKLFGIWSDTQKLKVISYLHGMLIHTQVDSKVTRRVIEALHYTLKNQDLEISRISATCLSLIDKSEKKQLTSVKEEYKDFFSLANQIVLDAEKEHKGQIEAYTNLLTSSIPQKTHHQQPISHKADIQTLALSANILVDPKTKPLEAVDAVFCLFSNAEMIDHAVLKQFIKRTDVASSSDIVAAYTKLAKLLDNNPIKNKSEKLLAKIKTLLASFIIVLEQEFKNKETLVTSAMQGLLKGFSSEQSIMSFGPIITLSLHIDKLNEVTQALKEEALSNLINGLLLMLAPKENNNTKPALLARLEYFTKHPDIDIQKQARSALDQIT